MKKLLHLTTVFTAFLALTPYAPAQQQKQPEGQGGVDPLVQIVRNATQQYQNVANLPQTYGPVLGCVSGSDHGAMGIHYVNGDLINGGTLLSGENLDPTRPQALIYEPQANGELKLVAVKVIACGGSVPFAAPPRVNASVTAFSGGVMKFVPRLIVSAPGV